MTSRKTRQRGNGSGTLFQRKSGGAWYASYYSADGRRVTRSTKTRARRPAERVLAKWLDDAALRREGVVDVAVEHIADANRRPLADHVADYLTSCNNRGLDEHHVKQKRSHLDRFCEASGAVRLSDITAEALERYMRSLVERGLSARTANFVRTIVKAFVSWAEKSGRVNTNRVRHVEGLDEQRDRRRERRALTDAELARLFEVAGPPGRRAWYMAAALAGLRKGDMRRLRWSDIDFDNLTITIRDGKARRADVLPMADELAAELMQRRAGAKAGDRVFPTVVTDATRLRDFVRAGIARRVPVLDENGEPVRIGKGKRERVKTVIDCTDDEGRVADLHALRTTLGTRLARAGVTPQVAQRIMRHSDYRTTLKHYTVLGLTDTARAIESLPALPVGAGVEQQGDDTALAAG